MDDFFGSKNCHFSLALVFFSVKLAFLSNYDKFKLVYINHYFDNRVTKSILLNEKMKEKTHTHMMRITSKLQLQLIGYNMHVSGVCVCVCVFDDMLSIFIYSSQSWETKAVLPRVCVLWKVVFDYCVAEWLNGCETKFFTY